MLKSEHIDYLKELARIEDPLESLRMQVKYLKNIKSCALERKPDRIAWITINPKPDVSLPSFVLRVQNYLKRSFIYNAKYVYEQRGESYEDIGRGFHVHILFDVFPGTSYSTIQRNSFNSFKNVVGNKKAVDVKLYPYSLRSEKEEYINGQKWESSKDLKIHFDKIFRNKNGLNI